ncbi:DUF1328 domain-containing protein [Candidatus Dependentiae bacterium]|nr:DUF1328 domain-containing protein [Candidatus Dependentiae bacterium]
MLQFIILFLVLALVAGLLGFSGVAVLSTEVARILVFVFLALLLFSVVSYVLGYNRRPPLR